MSDKSPVKPVISMPDCAYCYPMEGWENFCVCSYKPCDFIPKEGMNPGCGYDPRANFNQIRGEE